MVVQWEYDRKRVRRKTERSGEYVGVKGQVQGGVNLEFIQYLFHCLTAVIFGVYSGENDSLVGALTILVMALVYAIPYCILCFITKKNVGRVDVGSKIFYSVLSLGFLILFIILFCIGSIIVEAVMQ